MLVSGSESGKCEDAIVVRRTFGDEKFDGRRSLVQEDGDQGALIRPE